MAEAGEEDALALRSALVVTFRALGAPPAEAEAAAATELAFARELADAPTGTVLALRRFVEGGELRETFHRIDTEAVPHARVWEVVE